MERPSTLVFADGAAKGNPGPAGWGALIAFADGRIREIGGAVDHATNNQMELRAVIEALRALQTMEGEVEIRTDSSYVVRGITEWIERWKRRGWKTHEGHDVSNAELWRALDGLLDGRGRTTVTWRHVPGHVGVPGNERADAIASSLAEGRPIELHDGPASEYSLSSAELAEVGAVAGPSSGGRRRRKGKAYSYLSVIGGEPRRHATWAECEARVRGRSGARYKKAMTGEEEVAILAAWGFTPSDLS